MTSLPLLLVVSLIILVVAVQQDNQVLLGAGLVLAGMWSGTAVAGMFTAVARPTGYGSHSSSDTGDADDDAV
jgi:galactitol-specific phosphotransferase system IIC component